jgi:hypothetical protein
LQQLITDIEAVYPKEILENNIAWLKKRQQKTQGTKTVGTNETTPSEIMDGAQVTFKPGKKGMTFKPSRK